MNKKKISYIPFNLLTNIASWFVPFLLIPMFIPTLDNKIVIIISTYIYISKVFQQSEIDFLEDRIKSLEQKYQ
jgi:hypothetical protein